MAEKLFEGGFVRVLVCTSTLAWGVNLPAHAVIIKGTMVYDPEKGDFVPLGILDVLQIFGRAGRPQYETHGEAVLITQHRLLPHYLGALTTQVPIESRMGSRLCDTLNAEIALGSVGNIEDAIRWLKYTYLYIRMQRNPTAYGISLKERSEGLDEHLRGLVITAATQLRSTGMVAFERAHEDGAMRSRSVGRIASAYYISHGTIGMYGERMNPSMSFESLLEMACESSEFSHLRVRPEELTDLDRLEEWCGQLKRSKRLDATTAAGKAYILTQAHISRAAEMQGGLGGCFTLSSDLHYISQNMGRILRAIFEIVRGQGWAGCSWRALKLCKSFELRLWTTLHHPLAQFASDGKGSLSLDLLHRIGSTSMEMLNTMSHEQLSTLTGSVESAKSVKKALEKYPTAVITGCSLQTISQNILRVTVNISFNGMHGQWHRWWLAVQNTNDSHFYHIEAVSVRPPESNDIPIHLSIPAISKEQLPSALTIKIVSDEWLHAETSRLESLESLPKVIDQLGSEKTLNSTVKTFLKFSESHAESLTALQSRLFEVTTKTDKSILVSAPGGDGDCFGGIIYLASLRAKSVLCVSEDVVSRRNSIRKYATCIEIMTVGEVLLTPSLLMQADLLIIDLPVTINHLFESFFRKISKSARILALLPFHVGNPRDLSTLLGIEEVFNFGHEARIVPLEVRIEGIPMPKGRRENVKTFNFSFMNRHVYTAAVTCTEGSILVVVPDENDVISTVSSLISYCVNDDNPRRFVKNTNNISSDGSFTIEEMLEQAQIKSSQIRHFLSFGISSINETCSEQEQSVNMRFFEDGLSQILILPESKLREYETSVRSKMVIIKGSIQYINDPVRLLKIANIAGRPNADVSGTLVLLVDETDKAVFRHLLTDPILVESSIRAIPSDLASLILTIADQNNEQPMNINDLLKCILDGTFFGKRIGKNPFFYGMSLQDSSGYCKSLEECVKLSIQILSDSDCISFDSYNISITDIGRLSAQYSIPIDVLKSAIKANLEKCDTSEDVLSLIFQIISKSWQAHQFFLPQATSSLNSFRAILFKNGTKDFIRFQNLILRIAKALTEVSLNRGWTKAAKSTILFTRAIYYGKFTDSVAFDKDIMPLVEKLSKPNMMQIVQMTKDQIQKTLADHPESLVNHVCQRISQYPDPKLIIAREKSKLKISVTDQRLKEHAGLHPGSLYIVVTSSESMNILAWQRIEGRFESFDIDPIACSEARVKVELLWDWVSGLDVERLLR